MEDIIKKIKASGHNKIRFAICDIDGVLRSKTISIEKFKMSVEDDISFCDVLFGWDVNDSCYDNTSFAGWHTGYPDHKAHIDLSTFRTIPWENKLPYLLADFSQKGNEHIPCPRALLKRIYLQAEKLGFSPEFAMEFEWYNFAGTPSQLEASGYDQLAPISPGMFGYSQLRPSQFQNYCDDLFVQMEKFDIQVESFHTETGPGVYEASLAHNNILKAADNAALFKAGVKEIASRHGIIASFMAKWKEDLPGSGGHIHQSLRSLDNKKNQFSVNNKTLNAVTESYLAGILTCLPEILPMYAPTINSYKRLKLGAWAPSTVTWGFDNRTAAVRLICCDPISTRIEMRVPGADSNPYLAMSACLASGLYGIKHQLKLTTPASEGNTYESKGAILLPESLKESTQIMKNSAIAKELFDASFLEHFIASREWECREYDKAVTNWELRRYLEII